jgi:serine/threonine-protein kinase
MPDDALDLAVARYVRQAGFATAEQVASALQEQSSQAAAGSPISLTEALLRQGVITAAQRSMVEEKARGKGGVQQLGPYKLLRKLGEGGMGAVYLSEEPAGGGRKVALKVLPRRFSDQPELVKRFRREAQALARLRHPNIVEGYGAGEDLGWHYFVMEYCDGGTLDRVLAKEGRLPVGKALDLTLQIARGLQEAHRQGVIHRDIKPANVLLTAKGEAKILDLGLSKNLLEAEKSFRTQTGAIMGTPHYISPEQAQGDKGIDGRTDIYSLGSTLYHFLTGKPPFEGASALEIMAHHVNDQIQDPRELREDIPDGVVHIVSRMMTKRPADRYADCAELISDLAEVAAGRSPKTRPVEAALTTVRLAKPRAAAPRRPSTLRRAVVKKSGPGPLIAGVVGVAFLVAAVAMAVGSKKPAAQPVPPAPVPRAPVPAPAHAPAPVPAPQPDPAPASERSVDLLPDVVPDGDVVAGSWIRSNGEFQSDGASLCFLRLPYEPPEEYDVRVEFTPLGEVPDVNLLFWFRGRLCQWIVGGWGNRIATFAEGDASPEGRPGTLVKERILARGKRGLLELRVRKDRLQGYLDGELLQERRSDLDSLAPAGSLPPTRDVFLGVTSYQCPVAFHRVRVGERGVSGRRRPAAGAGRAAPDELVAWLGTQLRRFSVGYTGRIQPEIDGGRVVGLKLDGYGLGAIHGVQAFRHLRSFSASGSWDESVKAERRSTLNDVGVLRGLPLQRLSLHHTNLEDLRPLEGMKLEELDVSSTYVQDLAPLRGMPLRRLHLNYTRVAELTPLKGMPLEHLSIQHSSVRDCTPLAGLPIQELHAPVDFPESVLRSLPALRILNGNAWPPPAPLPPLPALPKGAIDLMPLIDPVRDAVEGSWKLENGRLVSGVSDQARLAILYQPPAEYDFTVDFVRGVGGCSTAQIAGREGKLIAWDMHGHNGLGSGFAEIAGKSFIDNPTKASYLPRPGVRIRSTVEVRKNRITAVVDGVRMSEWTPALGEHAGGAWALAEGFSLGVGSCEVVSTFERIFLVPVTGTGTPIPPTRERPWVLLADSETAHRVYTGGWKAEGDALVNPGDPKAGIAADHHAKDGEWRVRFEPLTQTSIYIAPRWSDTPAPVWQVNLPPQRPGRRHELLIRLDGADVSARLDGTLVPASGRPAEGPGRMLLWSDPGRWRVFSIEYRKPGSK